MTLESVPKPPKAKSSRKDSSYVISREMPPQEWMISELIDLYFEIDGNQAAHYNAKKDILLKLLDIQGGEDDDLNQMFIPDVEDIQKINEHLSFIKVDSMVLEAMDDASATV